MLIINKVTVLESFVKLVLNLILLLKAVFLEYVNIEIQETEEEKEGME